MSEEVNEKTLLAREELAGHYKTIINLLGEDVDREGLLKTPERVAKAMQFLTKGRGLQADGDCKGYRFLFSL